MEVNRVFRKLSLQWILTWNPHKKAPPVTWLTITGPPTERTIMPSKPGPQSRALCGTMCALSIANSTFVSLLI